MIAPFIVRIELDGGEDGTSETPATYTYRVRSPDGKIIGSHVKLCRSRPLGMMVPAETDTWAIAFSEADALWLWDTAEVAATAACT